VRAVSDRGLRAAGSVLEPAARFLRPRSGPGRPTHGGAEAMDGGGGEPARREHHGLVSVAASPPDQRDAAPRLGSAVAVPHKRSGPAPSRGPLLVCRWSSGYCWITVARLDRL